MLPYSNYINFPNYGLIISKVPADVLEEITNEVNEIKNDFSKFTPMNDYLAGNITHEYALTKSKKIVEQYVVSQTADYCDNFRYNSDVLTDSLPYCLDDLWVNFQRKGEFNPNHTHSGITSFTIWLDIPYLIDDEFAQSPGKNSNKNNSGCFEISYLNILGEIGNYVFPADKTYNGTMLMFPSKMNHCVYPFYSSDEYRITVAGNVRLKV